MILELFAGKPYEVIWGCLLVKVTENKDSISQYDIRFSGAIVSAMMGVVMSNELRSNIDILYHTIGRDMRSLLLVVRFMVLIKYEEWKGSTVMSLFANMVQRYPDKVVLKSECKNWTFTEVGNFVN